MLALHWPAMAWVARRCSAAVGVGLVCWPSCAVMNVGSAWSGMQGLRWYAPQIPALNSAGVVCRVSFAAVWLPLACTGLLGLQCAAQRATGMRCDGILALLRNAVRRRRAASFAGVAVVWGGVKIAALVCIARPGLGCCSPQWRAMVGWGCPAMLGFDIRCGASRWNALPALPRFGSRCPPMVCSGIGCWGWNAARGRGLHWFAVMSWRCHALHWYGVLRRGARCRGCSGAQLVGRQWLAVRCNAIRSRVCIAGRCVAHRWLPLLWSTGFAMASGALSSTGKRSLSGSAMRREPGRPNGQPPRVCPRHSLTISHVPNWPVIDLLAVGRHSPTPHHAPACDSRFRAASADSSEPFSRSRSTHSQSRYNGRARR